jgi:transcription elongation GreA/GreB family factor
MNKDAIREKMLMLEKKALEHAREKYLDFISDARLDRNEPIEADEQAQAEIAADLSEAFDQPVHNHTDKIAALKTIDFGPKSEVVPGAVVKIGARHFVISVPTDRFECEGRTFLGISTQAPIYEALEGKRVGESCTFNGRELLVEDIK